MSINLKDEDTGEYYQVNDEFISSLLVVADEGNIEMEGFWVEAHNQECIRGEDFPDGTLVDVGLDHPWYVQRNRLIGEAI